MLIKVNADIIKYQKEFEINTKSIYSQLMVTMAEGSGRQSERRLYVNPEQQDYFVDYNEQHEESKAGIGGDNSLFSRKESKLSQDVRQLVNAHMQDYQVRLYYEIEVQIM